MIRDRGAVLINALVIVVAIAAISAALLTRSERARVRGFHIQQAAQLEQYLDGADALIPGILAQQTEGNPVHLAQAWARGDLQFPIDRGSVSFELSDMQGRLNINWLTREDPFAQDLFRAIFTDLNVPTSLIAEITQFVSSSGPPSSAYLARNPPELPRGGSLAVVEDLRTLDGMTEELFTLIRPHVAALPPDSKLNLNTASPALKTAALKPFPAEVAAEFLQRDAPLQSISELRNRVQEALGTEDLGDLPVDRLTVGSSWFHAEYSARLDDKVAKRRAIIRVDPTSVPAIQKQYVWAVFD